VPSPFHSTCSITVLPVEEKLAIVLWSTALLSALPAEKVTPEASAPLGVAKAVNRRAESNLVQARMILQESTAWAIAWAPRHRQKFSDFFWTVSKRGCCFGSA